MTGTGTNPPVPEHIWSAIHAGHIGQVTIFCDGCGIEDTGDYTGETLGVRFAAARVRLAEVKGWRITEGTDLCPSCPDVPAVQQWAVRHPGLGVLPYDDEADARVAAGTAGTVLIRDRADEEWRPADARPCSEAPEAAGEVLGVEPQRIAPTYATAAEARQAGAIGWNIRCNRCGSYGAQWVPGQRPGWRYGNLALCPEDRQALLDELRCHERALADLRTVNYEQER